jgi:peptidoglycan/LPS O-acetylase OafA/YrhL
MCLHFEFVLRHLQAERDAAGPVASHPSKQETVMNWNKWIRQTHRWLSILFTLTVIANFVAMTKGPPPAWITYSPLPPLFLLLFSGLYMFFLPYVTRWHERTRAANTNAGATIPH